MTDVHDARAVLAAQPFNDLVGARVAGFGAGEAVLELDIGDRHRQQAGLVHGGVLAYLVDNTVTFACGSVLGPDLVTTGVTVSYLAGARAGTLRATARVDAADGRRAVASVHIDEIGADGSSRRVAVGQGTAARRRSAA